MLSRLFSKTPPAVAPPPKLPDDLRIYAIGDVHGRLDLLDDLLAAIDADDATRPKAETLLVFLGDLVDRGPQSAQVLDRVIALEQERPNTKCLLGNHEEVFLRSIKGDLKALAMFVRIGGRETILSYGVPVEAYEACNFAELLALWAKRVPAEHIAFLERCEDLLVYGDYAFVHAGVRPGEPLTRQRTSDLRWIRGDFLNHAGPFEKVVVHGHTISREIESLPQRIGLDTGAYATGKLSAMMFEGDRRQSIQAHGSRGPQGNRNYTG